VGSMLVPEVTKVTFGLSQVAYLGRIDHSASYGFWYSDDLGTVENASATRSANLYNEKSSKPHLNEWRPEKAT